jgi:hypothetical protein
MTEFLFASQIKGESFFSGVDLLKIFNIFALHKMKTSTGSYRNITVPNYFWWWFSVSGKMTQ